MQRIISLQTAMRDTNEDDASRDIRAFISKRTCISLIFTMSFFMLIMGFLLGKYVAERSIQIRHLGEAELSTTRKLMAIKKTLRATTRKMVNNKSYQYSTTNNENIWNELKTCMQHSHSYDEDLEAFVEELVESEIAQLTQCLMDLDIYIRNLVD